MCSEIRFGKTDDVFEEFSHMEKEDESGRYRSPYIYRGMPNSGFKLKTSLERNCRNNRDKIEKDILRNFTKYATVIENPSLIDSVWKQMIIGQHHGLPTRLLDWTYSALVALHFAVSENSLKDMNAHDCVIWAIDSNEINSLLPASYKQKLQKHDTKFFTIEMLTDTDLDKYDIEMEDKSFILLEPPSLDGRIVNQYSFFSVMPSGINDIECFLNSKTTRTKKYIISKEIRWQISDILDTMNINEKMLLPGYDGLCTWLKRHYFYR